jgi:protoporphyrin/coproporphyrin ferrochelatase
VNGVLLVNSGTPASLRTRDIRAFLAGLLGDPRVVELPRWLWLPILHGIILRIRPRASGKKYAAIWMAQGSPLAVFSEALRAGLDQALLAENIPVALAMLYTGGATVPEAIARLRDSGVNSIVVVPMFPQYSGATSGAVFDQVTAALRTMRHVPSLRFIADYHEDAGYIEALAASVQDHRREHGDTGHLLMSFHGIPERFVNKGDPYRAQCERTAELVAAKLGLGRDGWSLSFQSRFGRDRWLQPYTSEILAGMPKRGIRSVSVMCPGFAADCLETLEEIGMENRDVFLAAGGESYRYIAALNARPDHVRALLNLIRQEAGMLSEPRRSGAAT